MTDVGPKSLATLFGRAPTLAGSRDAVKHQTVSRYAGFAAQESDSTLRRKPAPLKLGAPGVWPAILVGKRPLVIGIVEGR